MLAFGRTLIYVVEIEIEIETDGRQQIANVNVSSVIEMRSTDTTSTRTELQRTDHAVMVDKNSEHYEANADFCRAAGLYSHCIVPKVCIRWEFRLMKSFRMSSSDTDISLR